MIIGPNYTYIAIPKTGSKAVRSYLIEQYNGVGIRPYHRYWHDSYTEKPTIFTVVRSPYERCFSRWNWECMRTPGRSIRVPFRTSFIDFMNWLVEHKYQDEHRPENPGIIRVDKINMSQLDFYRASECSRFVRLENFHKDFSQLPFVDGAPPALPLLRENTAKVNNSFFSYFTEPDNLKKAKEAVWSYCEEDFCFGYAV